MFSTKFWPLSSHYHVHMMDIPLPNNFSPKALELINQAIRISDAINNIQPLNQENHDGLIKIMKEKLAFICLRLTQEFNDEDTKKSLMMRAEILQDEKLQSELLPRIAALNENELLQGIGYMSTWIGKSKSQYHSAWFGIPNNELQNISDTVDKLFNKNLGWLKNTINEDLIALPFCSYKIVDLLAVAGEANGYPKHFAYFFPEDEGIKYSPVKRTVVFANTYLTMFEKFSRKETKLFGWDKIEIPDISICSRYLIAWFRGHDLGHSIVRSCTRFDLLSKMDRWGSMVIQESLADLFGFLMCTTEHTKHELDLDKEILGKIYLLELFRYLRRGACDFPDAGSAYIQLKYLIEEKVIDISNNHINVNLDILIPAFEKLVKELSETVLSDDIEKGLMFIQKYSPHHNKKDAEEIINRLGKTVDVIEYSQRVKECA